MDYAHDEVTAAHPLDESPTNPESSPIPDLFECRRLHSRNDRIVQGHGSGGRLTGELVRKIFVPGFGGEILAAMEDQATLSITDDHRGPRMAFTTDSFVVQPIFFPGGDIGRLSVYGTVNNLAVGGARPLYLSAAFILEEGLSFDVLKRVVASMRAACVEAGVELVTGDTKVVGRGKGDQIFITTTGVGLVPPEVSLSVSAARPGDMVVVSGNIGDHGIAIMSMREGLQLDSVVESDSASLADLTRTMLSVCPSIRCMRDPTRGGLSNAMNELSIASAVGIELIEDAIPVRPEVRSACEMLKLDPVDVASAGNVVAIVPMDDADELVEVMRRHPLGKNSAIIGLVVEEHPGVVTLQSAVGTERILSLPAGEQLPRIC